MKLLIVASLMVALTVNAALSSESGVPADSSAVVADTSLSFTLEIGSRLYEDWSEQQVVKLHQAFYLGDSEYMGVVRGFMPDFRMKDGEPINWSPTLNNPAAFVCVLGDSGITDSTWAFQNFAPHFTAESFFTFKLISVEGYVAPESTPEEK